MRSPEAEMQKVMRMDLLSLLSFRELDNKRAGGAIIMTVPSALPLAKEVTVSSMRRGHRVRRCSLAAPRPRRHFQQSEPERRQRQPQAPMHRVQLCPLRHSKAR
ncbi:hypothetical protein TcCL_ESM07847 [Trypanosoma cruzi]|nr:hypothetical protein TcCL_ESM07847 [Trypanosoma cruzi]